MTDEELLDMIDRDDISEIVDLSDEDDGFERDELDCHNDQEFDIAEENDDENLEQNSGVPHEFHEGVHGSLESQDEEVLEPENGEEDNLVDSENDQDYNNFVTAHDLTIDKKKIEWMEEVQYETRQLKWYSPDEPEIHSIESPIEFFERYIPHTLLQTIVEMTNLYAVQKNLNRFTPTTLDEIKRLIGIHIIMGNLKFPRAKMYWDANIGIPLIKENMTYNRFFKLRQALHLEDVTQPRQNQDRIWKVRRIYDFIRRRIQELPLETHLCVDEQIIPFKGRINIKQYMKNKPKKWGIKLYVLAGQSGQMYDFIIYQGATTEINETYARFGAVAGVVMQLTDRIHEPGHGLFIDNFFGTYNLFQYLHSKEIYTIGTIRLNRFANPPLMNDKQMKKKKGEVQ